MKKLAFISLIFLAIGCQKENLTPDKTTTVTHSFQKSYTSSQVVTSELIIYYEDGTTEAEKQVLRAQGDILDYRQCQCADENLELWIFEPDPIDPEGDIEDRRGTAHSKEDIENADFSTKFSISSTNLLDYGGGNTVEDGIAQMVQTNGDLTIAILDTGVDYNYEGFTSPFLYNWGGNGCNEGDTDHFGWNFVDYNNNPTDDYPGKHGTIVTHMITSNIQDNGGSVQILPVKVANSDGEIKLFDALCGFQYAAHNQDVDIINMSFGWYGEGDGLFPSLINKVETEKLIVTSAGNAYSDNDAYPHYPSSFANSNILTVAALSDLGDYGSSQPTLFEGTGGYRVQLAQFSNYGATSVDVAAIGENIPFEFNGETYFVSGTSFSSAYASSFAGLLADINQDALLLKQNVIASSISSPYLNSIYYSSFLP